MNKLNNTTRKQYVCGDEDILQKLNNDQNDTRFECDDEVDSKNEYVYA